ncbi:MAG: hypothetical protein Q8M22_17830 [Actinomycetota bacterium]|nr:hypothetical protein [Actinomycetota bacterium]
MNVLVLTPVKEAAAEAVEYVDRLLTLHHPAAQMSVGLLASDSTDGTFDAFAAELPRLTGSGWRAAHIWHRDFGYRIPDGMDRWHPSIQLERRRVLALSRNHLLFNALTDDIDWVLWLDADVVEYRPDIVGLLTSLGRDIVQPHCVRAWGGPTFDLNAWRDHGRLHLSDMRGEGFMVPLHAVGGTMLLVRADRHRDGLIWPAFPYGVQNPLIRTDPRTIGRAELGEIETEGLGMMAHDMGIECWGLPEVEIRHR